MIYTIGHGTRSLAELVQILKAAGVTMLVDVRHFPRSATNPQFNNLDRKKLGGIEYVHLPELDGRRPGVPVAAAHNALEVDAFRNYAAYMDTSSFHRGVDRLIKLSRTHQVCIMCAETLWWQRHRRMISDFLVSKRIKVNHLGLHKSIPHHRWSIAKWTRGNLVYKK
jgi:uncharacterized protein (DUF488 family)